MSKSGFKIMDSDIHVTEPPDLWLNYLEPKFKDRAPQFRGRDGGSSAGLWWFEGKAFPAFSDRPERQRTAKLRRENAAARYAGLSDAPEERRGSDPRAMLEAMDIEGIDVAIVFRTIGAHVIGVDGLDAELSAAICRAHNNWMAEFCDTDRDRLRPSALMPMHDAALAVEEARRAVRDLGAVTLVLPNHEQDGRPWYDPLYDVFWAEAERLGVPISFHGIQMAYQEHLARRYMDNFALAHSVAHPVEMMLALGSMLTGAVFERFPGLRAAFLEGHSSWVPWWLYCLDEHVEKFGDPERFPLKAPPSEYFRRHCFVSVDPDEHLLKYTLDAIGGDNIVISSDWPHDDSSYPHAMDEFLSLEGVSDEGRRKILWDNCARLYGLD